MLVHFQTKEGMDIQAMVFFGQILIFDSDETKKQMRIFSQGVRKAKVYHCTVQSN